MYQVRFLYFKQSAACNAYRYRRAPIVAVDADEQTLCDYVQSVANVLELEVWSCRQYDNAIYTEAYDADHDGLYVWLIEEVTE